jgi:hypothetical protein
MNKSANYQNARYSSVDVPGLHETMLAVQRHPMIKLVSREQMFSIFLEQAKRAGQPTHTARLTAGGWMLEALDTLAQHVTRHA